MVKLSLPSWDKDKSQFQAGTSFTPTITSRSRATALSSPSVFRRLKSPDSAASQTQVANTHPLMVLRLSSPSFLDSVVHDGSSDNPLYVIDTVDNVTKVRRSDPKGFVNISRVRWPMDPQKSMSRKNKDLTGVEVAFGKGQWRPADEFMGYSYSSLSSYRKFYIPHHKHSLKWKPSGAQYTCTTETVRGPVAILEPAMQRAPPQLKIIDPLFRVGSSRPQRMHNGLALSLLDFLLVTAMMLLTPNDEWTNVTRTNPSESVADSGHTFSSASASDPLRPLLHNASEATPEIELWRSSIPARVTGEVQSQCGESSDSSSSRATSRLSFRTDIQSTTQHLTYPSGQGVFPLRSESSLSLPAHSRSLSHHGRRRTRDLPAPPLPPSFDHNQPSATSIESPVTYLPHGQHPQNVHPPVPPLPTALSASLPPHDLRLSPQCAISASSRSVAASPTSSIHSRSLPTPPTSKPPLGLLSLISPNSAATATTASPVSEPAHHPTLSRAHSRSRLLDSASYPNSPHDHKPLVKAPPHYAANAPIFPQLPISAHTSVVMSSLNIQTNVPPDLSAGSATTTSADTNLTSGDPYDMPPAYSPLDMARSALPLRTVNGDVGSE